MALFQQLTPIEEGIDYFYRRSEVIQSNIANADTPFYKPKELLFEVELSKNLKLKRTDPRHIEPEPPSPYRFKEITLNDVSGYDGNKVNLDKELAKLAETALMARTLNEVLKKEIGKLKLVMGR
ncbi:flagellar basal body rod protein FlgB [Thermovibrio sp.]